MFEPGVFCQAPLYPPHSGEISLPYGWVLSLVWFLHLEAEMSATAILHREWIKSGAYRTEKFDAYVDRVLGL